VSVCGLGICISLELVSLPQLQLERDAVVLAALKPVKTKRDWENKAAGGYEQMACYKKGDCGFGGLYIG